MKRSRFAYAFAVVSALILVAMLVAAGSALAQVPPVAVTVTNWGQSEINEDGNLRFRVTASAGGIYWDQIAYPADEAPYLQLWALIVGPARDPTDKWVLIKSKASYNKYGQAATSISGTSPRLKLAPGTYTYYLVVVLNNVVDPSVEPSITALATSAPHLGGTVTLP